MITVTPSSGNVFADLGMKNPERRKKAAEAAVNIARALVDQYPELHNRPLKGGLVADIGRALFTASEDRDSARAELYAAEEIIKILDESIEEAVKIILNMVRDEMGITIPPETLSALTEARPGSPVHIARSFLSRHQETRE